ncbi:hypothetical protein [Georgenia sp. SYP-B2076]|uniref:hypothetical protein n=1 Tax=Georgenia sp. SYP-B2076 TaxID=2495881 RepID=UPI000F8CA5D1|nr:hypothetical protein [Georgenia sp. SYP-B2076]
MGVSDVPQWLTAAFTRSALAVGATAPREQIEETFHRLLQRWHDPDRHFHNVRHVIDVLARVDELAEETHHPDIVRLAAWYHGAVFNSTIRQVYSRSGGEDEVASAQLAREELGALGVPEKVLDRVTDLILNLKRHDANPRDIDSLALCDADLAVLASDPQRYRAYRKAVREEYAHIPTRHYLEARIAIATKLLARRHLFLSPMGAQWEDAARENLRAELDRLRVDLAALGECAPGESVTEAEAALDPSGAHGDRRPAAVPAPDARRAAEGVSVFAPSPAIPMPPTSAASPYATPSTPDSAARAVRTPLAPPDAARVATAAPTPGREGSRATAPSPAEAGRELGGPETRRPVQARTSSLESSPEDLGAAPRRAAGEGQPDREEVARSSRELVDLAVREGRERAERERGQRERLELARAERDRGQREPVEPARTGSPTPEHRRPARQPWLADVPTGLAATGAPDAAVEPERAEALPHHGMEREPDLFDRPARRRREKKVR